MSVATPRAKSLADLLLQEGLINTDQYHRAKMEYDRTSRSMVRIFSDMQLLSEEQRIKVLRKATGFDVVRLHDIIPSADVSGFVDRDMCRRAHSVPIRMDAENVTVAMEDPTDVRTIGDIEKIFGRSVKPVLATAEDIENTIRRLPEAMEGAGAVDHPSIGFRLFSSLMMTFIVFGPLVCFYSFANLTMTGKEFFESLGFSRFETVLLYVVTWSSWAAVGYFIHDLLFGKKGE